MLISLAVVPLFWGFFLWVLPRLEEMTLAPEERASKIKNFLLEDNPDDIERQVTQYLAQVVPARDRQPG